MHLDSAANGPSRGEIYQIFFELELEPSITDSIFLMLCLEPESNTNFSRTFIL